MWALTLGMRLRRFTARNTSLWNSIAEAFDEAASAADDPDALPVMTARTYKALDAQMLERLSLLAEDYVQATAVANVTEESGAAEATGDGSDAVVDMLAALSIRWLKCLPSDMLSCVRDVSVDRCVCDVTCWRRCRSGG